MENTKKAVKPVLPFSLLQKKSNRFGLIIGLICVLLLIIIVIDSSAKFTSKVQATSRPSGISLSFWMIPFKTMTVAIERDNKGIVDNSFWRQPISNSATNNETIESLGEKVVAGNYKENLIFDSGKDRLLYFLPSGYQQIRIINKNDFKELSLSKASSYTDPNSGITTFSETKEFKLTTLSNGLNSEWKAIQHSTSHVLAGKDIKDSTNKLSDGYTIVCYLPIQNSDSYLEFDEPQHSAGSEINLCEYLNKMGIRGVAKQ